ncbi:substrate-binding domain-containing protein [Actinomadura flavalba]|uniref:substrate-binding domain-containing protein n=1 Tax=Actinomadura flavalba TaxID=1120938 RepID=UPI00037B86A6|nr:substrate-binding domain-containing protein [Actinomadura flavalba]
MPDSPRWRRRVASAGVLVLGLAAAGTGCGEPESVTLTVLASSSVTEVLSELAVLYRHERPRVRIVPRFGGTNEMTGRVADREPAEVLITDDVAALKDAADQLTGRPRIVAHTGLTIAVAPGNPLRVRGPGDLARSRVRVVIGARVIPSGRYARQMFTRAGVSVPRAAEEVSSRAVLDRVRGGQADAGIVYVTDLRSAGAAAASVPIAAADNVTASFPAAVVEGPHEKEAAAFVAWLAAPSAARLFRKHGFATPVPPR